MEELTFKKVLTYLLLYVILPIAIFNSIGDYFTDHPQILESTIKIANQKNTTLNLIIIGIISGTLGALGHLIGKIFEDIISSKDSFIKRFPNDFFRVFFWVTTTIYLYISLIYSNEFTLGSVTKYSLLIGTITAFICGLAYPLLNKIFFNSYTATNQKNMMLESFIWFLVAGFIWGFVISSLWDLFILKEFHFVDNLYIGLITGTYGALSGFLLQITGGLGTDDSRKNNNSLTSFSTGFVFAIPVAITLFILHGNIIFSIISLYFGGILGLVLDDITPFSNAVFKRIRLALKNQHGSEGSAKVLMLLILLVLNAPWSALLCLGFIQFK